MKQPIYATLPPIQTHSISFQRILSIVIYLLLGLLLDTTAASAQARKLLKSHENMQRLEALDSSIQAERQQIEDFIQRTQHRIVPLKDVILPVVFHILHPADEDSITEQQVYAQLAGLNRDFGTPPLVMEHPALEQEKFIDRMDQVSIQFCLPELKGNIKDSLAINFHTTQRAEWGMDDAMKDPMQGGVAPWDAHKFINVWVVNLADSVSGYAQLPGGPAATDGIVIDWAFFGVLDSANADVSNRTLTHLIGNWLGLHSLWGESRCADDLVLDTPIHNAPNHGCPGYKHYSTCGTYQDPIIEMSMNFMDSSSDECLQFFTIGQKYRLHSFLSPGGPRAQLLTTKTDCTLPDSIQQDQPVIVQRSLVHPTTQASLGNIRVFPNPTKGMLTVAFEQVTRTSVANWSMQILNSQGQQVLYLPTIDQPTVTVHTRDWGSGIYFLSIQAGQSIIYTESIVVKH